MLRRFWSAGMHRTFSMSRVWGNLERAKPHEPPSNPSSSSSSSSTSSDSILDMSMSFPPTEFDKKILLLSGKFKSRKDIPSRIRYDTMDNAKSRLRIRISNLMMALTVFACINVIFIGKKKHKEGDSIIKRIKDRENELREEGKRNKQQ